MTCLSSPSSFVLDERYKYFITNRGNIMDTIKMLLNEAANSKLMVIDTRDNMEIYDLVEVIFKNFGWKDQGPVDDFDLPVDLMRELEKDVGTGKLDRLSVWSASKPSPADVKKFIDSKGFM